MADLSVGFSVLVLLLIVCIAESEAGSFCNRYYRSSYRYRTTYEFCTYGCCGSSGNEYCCGNDVGLIVGGIFACLAGLGILIAVICCCIKKKGYNGRVVQPSGPHGNRNAGANVTVVYTGASGQYPGPAAYGPQPMGAQPPPAYKQFDQPPPAYNYSDPAYPPVASPSTYPPQPPPSGFNPPQPSAPS